MSEQATNLLSLQVIDLDELHKRVQKLNRRAERAKCPPVTYVVVKSEERDYHLVLDRYSYDACGPIKWLNYVERRALIHTVVVDFPVIKLPGGWTLCAVLEHTATGNFIFKPEGSKELPYDLRSLAPNCEHCHTRRPRRKTVVMVDEAGQYKQVGLSCLAEYLGVSDALLKVLELWNEVRTYNVDDFGMADEEYRRSGQQGIPVDTFLTHVTCIAEARGYVSRKAAEENWSKTSTVQAAVEGYHERNYQKRVDAGLSAEAMQAAEPLATAILEWAKALPETGSEFAHNLRLVAHSTFCPGGKVGFVAAMYAAYKRAQEKERTEQEATGPAKLNAHFGEVGQRLELTLTLKTRRVLSTVSDGGFYKELYRFEDAEGRTFVWFASVANETQEGETYQVKGTIKEHSEFRGTMQTLLTRCKVSPAVEERALAGRAA